MVPPSRKRRFPPLFLPLVILALAGGALLTRTSAPSWRAQTGGSCIGEGQTGQWVTNDACCEGLMRATKWSVGSDGTCRDTNTWTCTKCGRDSRCGPGENPCNCPQECPYDVPEGVPGSCITEGNQGFLGGLGKCCPGLQPRAVNPNAARSDCTLTQGKFICTNCGNGQCGTGENACNCQDCVTYPRSSSAPSTLTATIEGDVYASVPGSATYHVVLTNISSAPLSGIRLSGYNNLPEVQLDPASSDPLCARGSTAGSYTCQAFDLAAGATKDLALTFTFPALQTNGTNIFGMIRGPVSLDIAKFIAFTTCGNGGQEQFEQCDDGNLRDGDGCSHQCHREADLSVSVSPPTVTERDLSYGRQKQLTYRPTVTNNGPSDVTYFKLRTSPLPGLTLNRSLSDASCSAEADASVTCTISETLPSGGSKSITIALETDIYGTWPTIIDFKIRPNSLSRADAWIDDPNPANDTGQVLCGNGVVDPGEECDQGGANSDLVFRSINNGHGPWCRNNCTINSASCGNGWWETWEWCDDGNRSPGDGCSAACTVESGWECVHSATSNAAQCRQLTCGNGTLDSGEQCDDGKKTCTDGTPCSDHAQCLGKGDSACLPRGGDGCSLTCQVEQGYQCSGMPSVCVRTSSSSASSPSPQRSVNCSPCSDFMGCGYCNGLGQQCVVSTSLKNGYQCQTTPQTGWVACGCDGTFPINTCYADGQVNAGGYPCCPGLSELQSKRVVGNQCWDGVAGNFCTACGNGQCSGTAESGENVCNCPEDCGALAGSSSSSFASSRASSQSSSTAVTLCGNGHVDPPDENCDDGNTVNGDGCSSLCRFECSDTDPNNDPGVRGTVRSYYCSDGTLSCGQITQQDSCVPGTPRQVAQYSCATNAPYYGAIGVVTANCPGTQTCQDGVCGYGVAASSSSSAVAVCGNGVVEGNERCEVEVACPPIQCFVPPCPTLTCDPGTCTCIPCPAFSAPLCPNGILIPQLSADERGCPRPPICCANATQSQQCTTTMICTNGRCVLQSCTCTACPPPTPPACAGGILIPQLGPDENGCILPPVCCANATQSQQCTTTMSCTNGKCLLQECTCSTPQSSASSVSSVASSRSSSSTHVDVYSSSSSSQSSSSFWIDECGNGNRSASEQCDDGNGTNGDGCSAACVVEAGWTCSDVCSSASIAPRWFSLQSLVASVFSFFTGEPRSAFLSQVTTCHSVCTRQQSSSSSAQSSLSSAQAFTFMRLSGSNTSIPLSSNALFGTAITPMGDLDGDGTSDIAVFAPGPDDPDANGFVDHSKAHVYILHLTPQGSVRSFDTITYYVSDPILDRISTGGGITAVGDLDGNGVPDLAVATEFNTTNTNHVMPYYSGKVTVLLLQKNSAGVISVKSQYAISAPTYSPAHCGSVYPTQCQANKVSLFGSSVAYLGGPRRSLIIGSVNGAWYSELSTYSATEPKQLEGTYAHTPNRMLSLTNVGLYPSTNVHIFAAPSQYGIDFYYTDAEDQMQSTSRITSVESVTGIGPSDTATLAMAGDLDGNGIDDLFTSGSTGYPSYQGMLVKVLLQRTNGYLRPKSKEIINTFTDASGASDPAGGFIAAIGDIDGNGKQDFAAGAPQSTGGGAVWLLLSNTAG